jgi:iron-sulfur cluster repair protein YtfE (RIC family)
MIDTPSAPVLECEPEWLARPITDLVGHITTFYHQHTREELRLLTNAAQRLVPSVDKTHAPRITGLLELMAELRDDVQTLAWAETDLILPLIVAHEHSTSARRVAPESLDRLASALAHEHLRIRGTLARMTEQLATPPIPGADDPSGEWSGLRERLLRLGDHVLEELAFEERCLLPRIQLIARMARTRERDLT